MTLSLGLVVGALLLLLTCGGLSSVALDLVELKDGGVMHQAVDGSYGHPRVGEDVAPAREGLVSGDEDAAPPEHVNDFAPPFVMNLLRKAVMISG